MSIQAPPAWYEARNADVWRCGHRHHFPSSAAVCIARAAAALSRDGQAVDGLAITDEHGAVVIPTELARKWAADGADSRLRLHGGPFDQQLVYPPSAPDALICIASDQGDDWLHFYAPWEGRQAQYTGTVRVAVRTPEVA